MLAKIIGARRSSSSAPSAATARSGWRRALPDGGRLITLEAEPRNAEVAERNIARAGLGDRRRPACRPRPRPAARLEAEGAGPFDLTFIDADKIHTPDYFAWALDHSRPGSLIVSDNVVRFGRLADPHSDDPTIPAQRRLHEMLAAEPRVEATTIQTVGGKGYDVFNAAQVII